MKYIKTYHDKINENIGFNRYENIKETKLKINLLLKTLFSIFQKREDINKMFVDSNISDISNQIYDYFTDIKDIIELKEKDLKIYAKNLDVLQETNLVNAIINKSYYNKYNSILDDDLNNCIKYLKDKKDKKSIIYLDNLIKLKNLLEN
ncbi:MAG: hypothetical protein WDA02_08575 [Saccharofermentanales bacterium]